MLVGTPSGHIGMTIYAANLSFALILFTILRAISIGIKLFAPADFYENALVISHDEKINKYIKKNWNPTADVQTDLT